MLARLVGRLKGASPTRCEAVLEEASAAIAIGSAAIEVRVALAAGTLPETIRAMAERAIGLLGDLRSNPGAAATRSPYAKQQPGWRRTLTAMRRVAACNFRTC